MKESQTIEFKSILTENLKYEVLAFANTDGGSIYVGVDDDGNAIGLENIEGSMLSITNMIRDSIHPDVTLFTSVKEISLDGKPIIEIDVRKGTERPYFLKGKGIRPEGVYVRQGTSSVPASYSAILKMIKETSDDSYERAVSLVQDLTFSGIEAAFRGRNLGFSAAEKRTLGLTTQDNLYTNLAFLLSDQCTHSIKAAVFEGDSKAAFKDRKEFHGSVLSQLEEAYSFINRYNRINSEFNGLVRTDRRDYPEQAIREALVNAIVHREYALSGPILINIFENRIEITTLGGLVSGLTVNDIMLGVSILRNRNLGNIFYRLQLIEAYGTGITKIMESYGDHSEKPKLDISDNAFRITLPNTNCRKAGKQKGRISSREEKIIDLFQGNETIARKDIEEALGVSQATAILIARDMVEKDILLRESGGKYSRYRLNEDQTE